MSRMRKLLSFTLACIMAAALMPVVSLQNVQAEEVKGTTELFKGNATYLLEEIFSGSLSFTTNGSSDNRVFSGWDVDYRGGKAYTSGGKAHLRDYTPLERISLNHKLMMHSGDFVLETAFSFQDFVSDGFYYELQGEDKTIAKLIVENGYLCVKTCDGSSRLLKLSASATYKIKAEFSPSAQAFDLWINGTSYGTYDYIGLANCVDEIEIATGVSEAGYVTLDFVTVYINYAVNETFMAAPLGTTPDWFTGDGEIVAVPGAPYSADPNGYALASGDSLETTFTKMEPNDSTKVSISWEMLLPKENASFEVANSAFNFVVEDGSFSLCDEVMYRYTNNVWYKIEMQTDGEKVYIFINNDKKTYSLQECTYFDNITFKNNGTGDVLIDNIKVCKTFNTKDFSDYPKVDEVPESDMHVGMVIYPMWREGIHYGWDMISPYDDRTPYLGYYTGGSIEAADWDNKWLLEHGFDHAIFPFARPDITEAGGQPSFSVRGEALHDGYLNSKYKKQLDFAIMITNPTDAKYDSSEDFVTNVTPFIVEHYLENPSYKVIDNRLVIYCYNFNDLSEFMGDSPSTGEFANINTAFKSLDDAAIALGYDGIMLMVDIQSTSETIVDNYISSYPAIGANVYKWHYTWGSDRYQNIANGIKNDYQKGSNSVASIPMGFDRTPWTKASIGIIPPEGVQAMCDAVVQYKGEDDPNVVVFTCWDEWGEGHFFAPSTKYGFDYLNVARKTFTDAGVKAEEDRPTEDAIRRMGVLYPEGRQMLKVMPDRKITSADDLSGLTSLGKINVSATRGTIGNGTSSYSNGKYSYTVTGTPTTITYDITTLGIDASKVTAIRINGYAENSATMVLYAKTTESTSINDTNFRFEGNTDGLVEICDTVLLPDAPEALKGTIEKIRFNPTASTSNGSKIYINEIEFYTGKIGTSVFVDDTKYEMVSKPEIKNSVAYIPAYQFLHSLGAYPLWNKATQTLTVEKDNTVVEFTAGSSTIKVNGKNKSVSGAPYYSSGNLFVPYQSLLNEFGYTAEYDADAQEVNFYSADYEAKKNYVDSGYKWDFNINGNTEGWTTVHVYGTPVVKDGLMYLTASTSDPVLNKTGLSISKSDAKYAIIRIKKTDKAESGMLRLYDNTTSASGVVYRFNIAKSDDIQEFIIDLTKDATVNATYTNTYEGLGNTITKLRLDPMDDTGLISIDSIAILPELPPDPEDSYNYTLNAYSFEADNLFRLDVYKNAYQFTNMPSSSGLPATETVDGYENVLKIVPNSGQPNCIFSISNVWYNNSKQALDNVSRDNRFVKVSFWYKAIGDTTSFRLENRAGGSLDGELITVSDASTSEWKYYEGYYDMSKVGNDNRWFSLRVYQTKSGGLYVRDYSYVCLDETKPLTNFNGDIIAIKANAKDSDNTADATGMLYVAEHKDDELSRITTVEYPTESKYYIYTPSENAETVKLMLWDDFIPQASQKVLNKE